MDTQAFQLKPDRLAALREYAKLHGQAPADGGSSLLSTLLRMGMLLSVNQHTA